MELPSSSAPEDGPSPLPLSTSALPELRLLHVVRYPIDGMQTIPEAVHTKAVSTEPNLSFSQHPQPPNASSASLSLAGETGPSSGSRGTASRDATEASLQPAGSNASFGPATLLRNAARAVATAVGDATSASSTHAPAKPDASLLTTAELKSLKSARTASWAAVDWKEILWVKQRSFYSGHGYQSPHLEPPPEQQQQQQRQPRSPPSSPSSRQLSQPTSAKEERQTGTTATSPPSLISQWFNMHADADGHRNRTKPSTRFRSQQEHASPANETAEAFVPHSAGTLFWILYGKRKVQRAEEKASSVPQTPQHPSSPAATDTGAHPAVLSFTSPSASAAQRPFISPAVVPAHLCPLEELMPGCLTSLTVEAVSEKEESPYVILSVAIYEGGFSHGAFHGSGRLTVFHRYVLECQWCQGVPLLTECCYGGAPCVLRFIAQHTATLLPSNACSSSSGTDTTGEAAEQRTGKKKETGTSVPPPASSFISFRKHALGYALWEPPKAEDAPASSAAAPPRFLSTLVFGNQYMGSLTVAMTVAATTSAASTAVASLQAMSNLLLLPQYQQSQTPSTDAPTAGAPGGMAPRGNPVEEVLLSHWRVRDRLFWTELMSFIPDGFGEMAFSSAGEIRQGAPDPNTASNVVVSVGPAGALLGAATGATPKPAAPSVFTSAHHPTARGLREGELMGRYYGGWRNGRRHGFGVDWDRPTGVLYVGVHHRDVRHGAGYLEVDATGTAFSASWTKGVMQPPANVALTPATPGFALQGVQWPPTSGVKPSPPSGPKPPARAEPTSHTSFFAFDQATLTTSRHSASGLWEPLFATLDVVLAQLAPVKDELLHLGETSTIGPAEAPPQAAPPLVSPQLDPIIRAVVALPEWRAALATFQRAFYFLYGRCPGHKDSGETKATLKGLGKTTARAAAAAATVSASLAPFADLMARGQRTKAAALFLGDRQTESASPPGSTGIHPNGNEGGASDWPTPSWCDLVGLRTDRVPPCLHSNEPGAVPLIHFTNFLPGPRASSQPQRGRSLSCSSGTNDHDLFLHFSRPCMHCLLPTTSTDKQLRTTIDSRDSLASQRGLSAGRVFDLAMHAVASFVSSLRLRLVSYIAAHPTACDVSSHQSSLLRYCWEVVAAAVAPLLHALAGAVVATPPSTGEQDVISEVLRSSRLVAYSSEGVFTTKWATAAYSGATAHSKGMDGLLNGFCKRMALGEEEDDWTAEEVELSASCATLFCGAPFSHATCSIQATSHGPLLSLSQQPQAGPRTPTLQAMHDTVTALVHHVVAADAEHALWQQQRLTRILVKAAQVAAGATDASMSTQHAFHRLRAVGFNPIATLLLLHSATTVVSPALPVSSVAALLSREMEALRAAAGSPAASPSLTQREKQEMAGVMTPPPALPPLAQALLSIYYTRTPTRLLTHSACSASTPLHELNMRSLFCLLPCGARWCQRRLLLSSPPAFTEVGWRMEGSDDAKASRERARVVCITAELTPLRLYFPTEKAFAAAQQALRDTLALTELEMAEALEAYCGDCDPYAQGTGPRVPPKGSFAAFHLPFLVERKSAPPTANPNALREASPGSFLSQTSRGPASARAPASRHSSSPKDATTPELVEWLLHAIHELFLPPKESERASAQRAPAPCERVWRTFLYGTQQQPAFPSHQQTTPMATAAAAAAAAAGGPGHLPAQGFPPLLSEETFWYAQLLSTFLKMEFGLDLSLHVGFSFGGDDDDGEENQRQRQAVTGSGDASASKARFTMSSSSSSSSPHSETGFNRCLANPSPSPRRVTASAAPSPEKPTSTRSVQLSATPEDHPVELSPSTAAFTPNPVSHIDVASGQEDTEDMAMRQSTKSAPSPSPSSPPPPPPLPLLLSRSIVGREVTLTVKVPNGFAGSLDWELLADRWSTAVSRLALATGSGR